MGRLLEFIIRFHALLLFILLEALCAYLLTFNNTYQGAKTNQFVHSLKANIFESLTLLEDYTLLKSANYELARDNAQLLEQLKQIKQSQEQIAAPPQAMIEKNYSFTAAKIIKASLNFPLNYLMINKGTQDGIEPGMGVIGAEGVVGVVYKTSTHYASVLPIINTRFTCLTSLKNYSLSGSTRWDGQDYRYVYIDELPLHIDVAVGDTILTNNNSQLFPNDIMIGKVAEVKRSNLDKFFELKVELETDFSKLKYVYVIKDERKEEWLLLEEKESND